MSQIISVLRKLVRSKEALIALIIILVATGSFGLGRLSVQSLKKENFQINRPVSKNENNISQRVKSDAVSASAINSNADLSGKVVASKNGAKYHFPWCSG